MIEVESKAKIPNPKKFRVLAQTIGHYKGKQKKVLELEKEVLCL